MQPITNSTKLGPSHNNNQSLKYRRALSLIEVIIILGIAIILIVIFILMLPMMKNGRFRRGRISPRVVCSANLMGIGKGMYTYANENKDYWPIAAPFAEPTKDEFGSVKYVGVIGKDEPTRGRANDPDYGSPERFMIDNGRPPKELSTTRNLWILVRTGASAPSSFICYQSNDTKNDEDNPQNYWDFGVGDENKKAKVGTPWQQCSYGYQVPYGKMGSPNSDRQQDMPLAADKGPFSGAYEANMAYPGVPQANSKSGPDKWAPWNSPNHGGEGQNVLFADSHVDFFNTPIVGIKNDNIYTRWSSTTGGSDTDDLPRVRGTPPTSNQTPWSNTDTLIYP
ncbi:MAG: hypothetical protein ACYTF1_02785 [Planctomycetota bacterium]|jgi:hypothetical protein